MFEQVAASIPRLGNLSPENLSVVLDLLKHLTVKKGDCLIKEGQVCQTFYFIHQGCFQPSYKTEHKVCGTEQLTKSGISNQLIIRM